MPRIAPDQVETTLIHRERDEAPEARAARRAYERWITWRRVWAACDRAAVVDPYDRARFIFDRLWPDLPESLADRAARQIAEDTAAGRATFVRPRRASDVVGERLAALMVRHRYPTE